MAISPQNILDAGCGTGYCTRALQQKFPKASLTGIDIAQGMIEQANKQNKAFGKIDYQCADIEQLPFAENHFDLVFSSLSIQWASNLEKIFTEFNRVLKTNGVLMFSTLATNTLTELKQSWQAVDQQLHVNQFTDSNTLFKTINNSGFIPPELNNEVIILTFNTVIDLMKSLKAIGANNVNHKKQTGLLGKNKLKQLQLAYEKFKLDDGKLPASYDVIYGYTKKLKEQTNDQ